MPAAYKKVFTEETEEELFNMTRAEATLNLNDKQIKFCEEYARTFNIKLSAVRAGYSKKSAHTAAWKIRQNPDCSRYIAWLKLRVSQKVFVEAVDIIDHYARIAFSDITDVCEVKDGKITVQDTDMIDGQIVKSIKKGRDGVTVELYDKMTALSKLERYFDVMPKDWKQQLEERKVKILEERLEIEKKKMGVGEEITDDGFIEALKATAESVWEDYDDENVGD